MLARLVAWTRPRALQGAGRRPRGCTHRSRSHPCGTGGSSAPRPGPGTRTMGFEPAAGWGGGQQGHVREGRGTSGSPQTLGAGGSPCPVPRHRGLCPRHPVFSPAPQGGLQQRGDAAGEEAACQQLASSRAVGLPLGQGRQQEQVEGAEQGGLHGEVLRGEEDGRPCHPVPQHRAGAQPAPQSLFPSRTSGPDPPSDLGSSSCPQPSPLAPSPRCSPLTCRARQQLSTQEHIFSGEQAGRAGLPAPGARWPPPFMLLPPPCCLPHLVGQGPTPPRTPRSPYGAELPPPAGAAPGLAINLSW